MDFFEVITVVCQAIVMSYRLYRKENDELDVTEFKKRMRRFLNKHVDIIREPRQHELQGWGKFITRRIGKRAKAGKE